jgi:hypothetical protein
MTKCEEKPRKTENSKLSFPLNCSNHFLGRKLLGVEEFLKKDCFQQ